MANKIQTILIPFFKTDLDILNDSKIKMLRKMPEGDTLFVLWIGLLSLAMKANNPGTVELGKGIPFTADMLAAELDIKISTIRMGIELFRKLKMIDILGKETIYITNFEKHQNLEKIRLGREATRKRVAKHREKVKLLVEANSNRYNGDCNANVTKDNFNCNGTDIELDKDKDKDIDIDIDTIYSAAKKSTFKPTTFKPTKKQDPYLVAFEDIELKDEKIPYSEIIDFLNNTCSTAYKYSTSSTKKLIKARFNEGFNIDNFKTVILNQYKLWNNSEYEQYLRPATLFGTKFENYLNTKTQFKNNKTDDIGVESGKIDYAKGWE